MAEIKSLKSTMVFREQDLTGEFTIQQPSGLKRLEVSRNDGNDETATSMFA
ncbi:hypothetical protein RvY_18227 [Ramazzottius varieornatus]|uniref:Uncharacterized protein n=1 Tax=Ramazzottius varieornatus TaxID=947166 RepID=A0A1D1W5J4_RAMVA|nr:hypothetical protein RvY_18227 [Ramazzottius varieornatus]